MFFLKKNILLLLTQLTSILVSVTVCRIQTLEIDSFSDCQHQPRNFSEKIAGLTNDNSLDEKIVQSCSSQFQYVCIGAFSLVFLSYLNKMNIIQ